MRDTACRCKGTGWVKVRIPAMYKDEYGGMDFGWAWCGDTDHPATDESFPEGREDEFDDPKPYSWEPV